jgi:hypothetical protein
MVVETQSHMGSILSLLESTNTESQNHDHSLLQDPHHQGFKWHQGTTSFQRSI